MSFKLFSKLLTESYLNINIASYLIFIEFCDSVMSDKINLEHIALKMIQLIMYLTKFQEADWLSRRQFQRQFHKTQAISDSKLGRS